MELIIAFNPVEETVPPNGVFEYFKHWAQHLLKKGVQPYIVKSTGGRFVLAREYTEDLRKGMKHPMTLDVVNSANCEVYYWPAKGHLRCASCGHFSYPMWDKGRHHRCNDDNCAMMSDLKIHRFEQQLQEYKEPNA